MTNEEYIYRWLRSHGYTHNGTCAIMGSMQSESGFIPYRLEEIWRNLYIQNRWSIREM